MSTSKTFSVSAKIILHIDVRVEAEDIQAALEKGQKLKMGDFVEIKGDHIDGTGPHVIGVYSQEEI